MDGGMEFDFFRVMGRGGKLSSMNRDLGLEVGREGVVGRGFDGGGIWIATSFMVEVSEQL